MISGSIARRYARALYELAREEGKAEETGQALAEIADAVTAMEADGGAEPFVDRSIGRRIGRALAERVGADSTLGKFLSLVADRNRLRELPAMHQWYVKLEDQAAGRARLSILSAGALESSVVDAIVSVFAKIANLELVPEVSQEPELLGGAVVELEGRVYDGSTRTLLARLAGRMTGSDAGLGRVR